MGRKKLYTDRCSVDGCRNVEYARSWCRSHYDRNRNYGSPTGGPHIEFRTKRAHILDVLEADGGWLSAAGIQLLVPDLTERQISESCRSATSKGMLRARQIEMAAGSRTSGRYGVDVRWEWRTL